MTVDTSKIEKGDLIKAETNGMVTKDWHKVTSVSVREVVPMFGPSAYKPWVFGTEHGQWFMPQSIIDHKKAPEKIEIELPEALDPDLTVETLYEYMSDWDDSRLRVGAKIKIRGERRYSYEELAGQLLLAAKLEREGAL